MSFRKVEHLSFRIILRLLVRRRRFMGWGQLWFWGCQADGEGVV